MEMRIDRRLINGLTYENTTGTHSVSAEGLVTFNASTGTMRRTRWIPVTPGDTLIASVQMRGGEGVSLRIHESVSGVKEDEIMVAKVISDSATELKVHSISYTVPVTSSAKLVGISFVAENSVGVFYSPKIEMKNFSMKAPQMIACGLVDMTNGTINANFPNFGVKASIYNSNKMVNITLSAPFKSGIVRPLVFATEGTHSHHVHGNKLVAGNIGVTDGVVDFAIYYVDPAGVIVSPPNGTAQFVVYY